MEKIKAITITLLFSFVIYSCNESVKCNGFFEKQTLKDLLQELVLENEIGIGEIYNDEEFKSHLNYFFSDVFKLELVRTNDIKKNIKKCECSANVKFELKPEIKNFLQKKEYSDFDEFSNSFNLNIRNDLNIVIDYSVQETGNGEYIVETYLPERLRLAIFVHYIATKAYEEENQRAVNYNKNKSINGEKSSYGIINETNVFFRESPSTESDILGSFDEKGERVKILEDFDSSNSKQAFISKDVYVKVDGERFLLVKDKAIDILSTYNNSFKIKFKDKKQDSHKSYLKKRFVKQSSSNVWYKIKRKNGQSGWIFGKFVSLQ